MLHVGIYHSNHMPLRYVILLERAATVFKHLLGILRFNIFLLDLKPFSVSHCGDERNCNRKENARVLFCKSFRLQFIRFLWVALETNIVFFLPRSKCAFTRIKMCDDSWISAVFTMLIKCTQLEI